MSNNLVNTIVKIFSWGIMGASVVIALVFFLRISNAEADALIGIASSYILWAVVLLGLAALLSVLFPLVQFILNPKNAVKALVGLASLGLVFLVAYFMADTTPIVSTVDNADFSNPAVLRFADTGILATYFLFGCALLALVYTGVRGLFKL